MDYYFVISTAFEFEGIADEESFVIKDEPVSPIEYQTPGGKIYYIRGTIHTNYVSCFFLNLLTIVLSFHEVYSLY